MFPRIVINKHSINLGPLHTRDWEPVTIPLQAVSLVEKSEPVQVRYFTLRSRDLWNMWMQDGCKVYVDFYMASNGSCFMVTWTLFKNHLLKVGQTQIQVTMALRALTMVVSIECHSNMSNALLLVFKLWKRQPHLLEEFIFLLFRERQSERLICVDTNEWQIALIIAANTYVNLKRV